MIRLGFTVMFAVLVSSASIAANPGKLSVAGTDFGRIAAGAATGGLSVSVALEGSEILSTHAVARFQNNAPRKRMESGYWVPWDGRIETMADLGLSPSADGVLTFPLVDEDLSAQFLPITFTVIVRTVEDVRWGYVVIDQ